MKNPIKNGKEVFAVLSVATIMSLSMSVKTDAASESKKDLAAESAYTQTIINDIRTRRYAALAEASQELKATDFIGLGNELELGDEIIPAALRAPEKSNDPNYLKDEQNVGFYKDTQLERGNGPYAGYNPTTEMDRFIDGFRYNTLEPSATSESLTKYGFEIEFDKEKGQRTYTSFAFTNSGLLKFLLDPVTITAKSPEKGSLGDGFKTPNYKANTVLEITNSGRQMNLNALNTIEDLEHINNKDIINTTMVWEGNYTKDNPNGLRATQGNNALYSFTVNPWPNENDVLDLIYLNGDYEEKQFVQGQEINTGIKVENLDANARERLVGQVYHPVSGEVVPGAEAYIDANDMVVVKMPEGALRKMPMVRL